VGCGLRGRIVRTILRGQTIQLDGKLIDEPRGRFLCRRGGATELRSTLAHLAAKRNE
jgi:hypothetical protein